VLVSLDYEHQWLWDGPDLSGRRECVGPLWIGNPWDRNLCLETAFYSSIHLQKRTLQRSSMATTIPSMHSDSDGDQETRLKSGPNPIRWTVSD